MKKKIARRWLKRNKHRLVQQRGYYSNQDKKMIKKCFEALKDEKGIVKI